MLKRKFIALCILICLFSSSLVSAQSERGVGVKATGEKRIALIIGNAEYANDIGRLTNPVNDASDIAVTLKSLGFELVGGKAHLNQNFRQMDELVREFGRLVKNGGVGVFYFAGHGIQSERINYLVPIGAKIEKQQDLRYEAYSAERVLGEMEAAENRLNILILDACRNNPLTRSVRSADKGLTQPSRIPTGTYVAFAARDGQTSSENEGNRNGLYTQELLKNIKQPNLRLEDVFINTRREVRKLSNNQQTPEEYGSVDDIFYFAGNSGSIKPIPQPVPTPIVENSRTGEDVLWDEVTRLNSKSAYQTYLTNYPGGKYVATARLKIQNIEAEAAKQAERRKWAEAERLNTIAGYQSYLSAYPGGEYKGIANLRINDLKLINDLNSLIGKSISNSLGMKFMGVPAGSFQMGDAGNGPIHKVTLTQGFYMGQTEVTQREWKAVMGSLPTKCDNGSLRGEVIGDNKPVICVSWDDAQEFIRRLNRRGEGTYRLPTEAEWEYAARAGTTGDYAGNLDAMAWYVNNSGGKTHDVGTKQPNAWGLYDMHGNVQEWVQDWFGDYPSGSVTNPTGAPAGSNRVIRLGSWINTAADQRSAFRYPNAPSNCSDVLGFRVVLSKPLVSR